MRVYSLEVGPTTERSKTSTAPFAKPKASRAPQALAAMLVVLLLATGGWFGWQRWGAPPRAAAHLSIVVLPFANLSGDASQDYFADGVTENLTTDLSRLAGAFVIARNTAFTFKGKNIDAKAIGEQLGVRYVLEGSVQRDGDRPARYVGSLLIAVQAGRAREMVKAGLSARPALTAECASSNRPSSERAAANWKNASG